MGRKSKLNTSKCTSSWVNDNIQIVRLDSVDIVKAAVVLKCSGSVPFHLGGIFTRAFDCYSYRMGIWTRTLSITLLVLQCSGNTCKSVFTSRNALPPHSCTSSRMSERFNSGTVKYTTLCPPQWVLTALDSQSWYWTFEWVCRFEQTPAWRCAVCLSLTL